MTPFQLRWVAVITYVLVDLVYVFSSRSFYETRIRLIQDGTGKGFSTKPDILPVALLTYAFMGIGWWWLVASQITPTTPVSTTFAIAIAFALIVHGVFNGTLYVMFDNWDWPAMLRDTTWGLIWITSITFIYRFGLQMLQLV
jgi:hypothetical protein